MVLKLPLVNIGRDAKREANWHARKKNIMAALSTLQAPKWLRVGFQHGRTTDEETDRQIDPHRSVRRHKERPKPIVATELSTQHAPKWDLAPFFRVTCKTLATLASLFKITSTWLLYSLRELDTNPTVYLCSRARQTAKTFSVNNRNVN